MTDRKYTPAYTDAHSIRGYDGNPITIEQDAYRFDNGFGLTVTFQSRKDEYGEWGWWEAAVVRFDADGGFRFVYGSEVNPCDAVVRVGSQRYSPEVEGYLDIISRWPADMMFRSETDHGLYLNDQED